MIWLVTELLPKKGLWVKCLGKGFDKKISFLKIVK